MLVKLNLSYGIVQITLQIISTKYLNFHIKIGKKDAVNLKTIIKDGSTRLATTTHGD